MTAKVVDLEEIYCKISYRMAATKAYESIMADRIAGFRLTRLTGFQEVRGFLNRRMTPVLDSCHAFSKRLEKLSAYQAGRWSFADADRKDYTASKSRFVDFDEQPHYGAVASTADSRKSIDCHDHLLRCWVSWLSCKIAAASPLGN